MTNKNTIIKWKEQSNNFSANLPKEFPPPEIGIDDDMLNTDFDWIIDKDHYLSVSVDDTNYISYACICGENKYHGSLKIEENVMEDIIEILNKIYNKEKKHRFF